MTSFRIAAVLLAFAACAPITAPPGSESRREYANPEWRFGLTIPSGWVETPGAGGATEALRLRSSSDVKATVTVSVVPLGSKRCRIAIEEWLPAAKAAAFKTTVDRSARFASGEVAQVTGEIEQLDGEASGALSAFCERDSAVIAVGLGRKARESELASIVSSLRYLEPIRVEPTPTPKVVKKPASKRKPPPRTTRPPKPKPPAAPEPAEAPEPTAAPEPQEADEILPER